jgi:hypothetical protein
MAGYASRLRTNYCSWYDVCLADIGPSFILRPNVFQVGRSRAFMILRRTSPIAEAVTNATL